MLFKSDVVGIITRTECLADLENVLDTCIQAFLACVKPEYHDYHNLLLAIPDTMFNVIICRVLSSTESINSYIYAEMLDRKKLLKLTEYFDALNQDTVDEGKESTNEKKYYPLHRYDMTDTISQIPEIYRDVILPHEFSNANKFQIYFLAKIFFVIIHKEVYMRIFLVLYY